MTLFLDRDGVINQRSPGEYVKSVEEFHFMPKVLEAMSILATKFDNIFIVTNQAGICKGLMTRNDVETIHKKMTEDVKAAGGRIDAVYYCPHTPSSRCYCRKPEPGMAWDAKSKYQKVDYTQSWMVGDSASDILFGQQLGMRTALMPGKHEDTEKLAFLKPTVSLDDLFAFAEWVTTIPNSIEK